MAFALWWGVAGCGEGVFDENRAARCSDGAAYFGPPTDACALAASEPDNALAAATCRAIEAFVRGDFLDAPTLLIADVTARRFRVEALAPLWRAFEDARDAEAGGVMGVFARLGDADVTVTAAELSRLDGPVDAFTAPALHCREHPLPEEGYVEVLREHLSYGGYSATHVLLALFWLEDRGCTLPVDQDFYEEAIAATAVEIDSDHAEITDLEIESAAFLAYLGEEARIPEGFLEGVIAAQKESGGFANPPSEVPLGHTSSLALWYLHESLYPRRTAPMIHACSRRVASPDAEEADAPE